MLGPHTHTPAPTARGRRTPTAWPVGGRSGEGQRLTSDAPHNGGRQPPRGRRSATPTASNAGPQGRTRDTRVAEPRPPAPEDWRPGEGQRVTPDAPHNDGRPPPPVTAPHNPGARSPHRAYAGQGGSVGPPHPHTRAHSTWVADPNSPPSGRAVGGGTAPDLRRPSHNGGKHPPRGRPSATPTASNAGMQGRTP